MIIRSWHCIRLQLGAGATGHRVSRFPLQLTAIMRWLFSFLALVLLGVVHAKSYLVSRLLVILEEQSDKEKYSVLFAYLNGKWYLAC